MKKAANDNKIILPLPPALNANPEDIEIYARFMGHLRHVPNRRLDIKILSAVQFTADMLNFTDAQVCRILVDLGLRAPRSAFPSDFLKFTDRCLMRSGWEVGGPSAALLELKAHWDETGEDKFAPFKGEYALVEYPVTV
ncbi:MAG: hypothetical protein IT558_05830 [Alphaproteobacteria bacterium]|nr:hypothetical protein [Alphaproteobacteria bacterium]